MQKYSINAQKLRQSVRLVATLFVLLTVLFPNVTADVYMSLLMEPCTTVTTPPVILEAGTAGNSTIYTNGTSAKASVAASAPIPTYYPNGYNVLTGTYVSGSVPASVQTVDTDYLIARSSGTAPSTTGYNPSDYILLGSTTNVSGTTSDLQSNNNIYMTFRSYATQTSAQTLFAHQETINIGGTNYYQLKTSASEAAGTTFSASMGSTGRQLFDGNGKFVYSLAGVTSIPSATWTSEYRTWRDADQSISYDTYSAVETNVAATSASWNHVTGSGYNRLLVVEVSVHVATGTPTTVTGVTYDGNALTQVCTDLYSTTEPQVRTYIYRLINPATGTKTIQVNFAASTLYVCGAVTYFGVDQTTPVQTSQTATGSSTTPSVSVTVTGTGRAVFGYLAGYRTAASSTQVTFQAAGAGAATTTTTPLPVPFPSGLQANDLLLMQITICDTTTSPTTPAGWALLYGPDSTGTGRQWVFSKIATGSETGNQNVDVTSVDIVKIGRMYAFRNADTSSFTEGGGFGTGSVKTVSAQSVTTSDVKRLAVSLNFIDNDNTLVSFTGETGGDWTEAVEDFTTTAGSDGAVELQTATMASAGTISGGTASQTGSSPWTWGVRAFAIKPATTWVMTEGSGQNNRWAKETYLYKGRGSDKLNVAAGSVSMSWTTNQAPNWVCSAVVINPVPSPDGHCDVDIVIRKSDNTIRSTIGTNVANSNSLTPTESILSVDYSFGGYTVIDQTDYLEFDYYVDVSTACDGISAYLKVDYQALAEANQTRTTNITLPSEFTCEVEFTGTSNIESWTQLVWTVDSSFTTTSVTTTFQLYNYQTGYPTSGDGYMTDTIGTSDVNKTQTITTNSTYFRDASGNWKIKVKGVKSTSSQFDLKADWVEFKPTPYSEYTVSTEFLFSSMTKNTPTQLNFTIVSQYNITNVNVTIQVWNYSSSPAYVTSGQGYLTYISSGSNETKTLSISVNPQFYTSSGNARIKITGVKTTSTQYEQEINQVKLLYSYNSSSIYNYVLKVVNNVTATWKIRLKAYSQSNIGRLNNCTIYFRNASDGFSGQVYIVNGNYTQQTGSWYDLPAKPAERYIAVTLQANNSEVSYINVYLEILIPDKTTYARYILTFEFT